MKWLYIYKKKTGEERLINLEYVSQVELVGPALVMTIDGEKEEFDFKTEKLAKKYFKQWVEHFRNDII